MGEQCVEQGTHFRSQPWTLTASDPGAQPVSTEHAGALSPTAREANLPIGGFTDQSGPITHDVD